MHWRCFKRLNFPIATLRSKSWAEFAAPSPIDLDFVFTVCDNAAGEVCPVWPGQPMSAHWGIPDPVAVQGSAAEIARAFNETLPHAEQPHLDFCQSADRLARRIEPAKTARRYRPHPCRRAVRADATQEIQSTGSMRRMTVKRSPLPATSTSSRRQSRGRRSACSSAI